MNAPYIVAIASIAVLSTACSDVIVPAYDVVDQGFDTTVDSSTPPPDVAAPDPGPAETSPDTAPPLNTVPEDYAAYYPFDGDDEDYSGNEHDLDFAYEGTYGTDRWGFAERAYQYEGSGNGIYYATGMAEGLLVWPEVTIAVWISGNSNGNDRRIAGHHDWFKLSFGSGGRVEFGLDTAELGEFWATSEEPHLEVWTLYVGTASRIDDGDGDMQVSLYKDGELVGSTVATGVASAAPSSCQLFVGPRPNQGTGCNQPGAATQLNAMLDDVRVYRRALSPNEVKALYHEGGWDL